MTLCVFKLLLFPHESCIQFQLISYMATKLLFFRKKLFHHTRLQNFYPVNGKVRTQSDGKRLYTNLLPGHIANTAIDFSSSNGIGGMIREEIKVI